MKVGRWLLDKACPAVVFLSRMLGVHAQMRLNFSRGDSE
jgi:hypothetical protein